MFKKCKVVMIPTDKKSSIVYSYLDNEMFYNSKNFVDKTQLTTIDGYSHTDYYNIYIIEPSDVLDNNFSRDGYYIRLNEGCSVKNYAKLYDIYSLPFDKEKTYKVIASTDKSLGLPNLPVNFIKKYCNLNGIDEVLVQYNEEWEDWCDNFGAFINGGDLVVRDNNTVILKKIKTTFSKEEMFENMQYYYEYLNSNKYITPHEWFENEKHF